MDTQPEGKINCISFRVDGALVIVLWYTICSYHISWNMADIICICQFDNLKCRYCLYTLLLHQNIGQQMNSMMNNFYTWFLIQSVYVQEQPLQMCSKSVLISMPFSDAEQNHCIHQWNNTSHSFVHTKEMSRISCGQNKTYLKSLSLVVLESHGSIAWHESSVSRCCEFLQAPFVPEL